MRNFDYNFLKFEAIPSQTVNLLNSFEAKYGQFQLLLAKYPKIFGELTKIAIVQSVRSSNEIEGIVTSDDRIIKLLNNEVAPKNHDEQEILGYKDALNKIHLEHESMQFTNEEILELHAILLSYLNVGYTGKFKANDNAIIEIDKSGMKRIRFKPISAKETPVAMEQLYLALLDALNDSKINSLLLIPCYILDFLCIYPFSDGNGRMSRLLTSGLLYKTGYQLIKYVSYENQINLYKGEYYDALKYASLNWHDSNNDYFYFIDHFFVTLIRTLNEIEKRFNIFVEKTLTKEERIKETILSSNVPLSKQDIFLMWPDISISTLDKVLIKLQKEGLIKRSGGFRKAKYSRK